MDEKREGLTAWANEIILDSGQDETWTPPTDGIVDFWALIKLTDKDRELWGTDAYAVSFNEDNQGFQTAVLVDDAWWPALVAELDEAYGVDDE